MKTALTIAGSDCNGGAGIQANWKTSNGVYVTRAITAQNTTGVSRICAKGKGILIRCFGCQIGKGSDPVQYNAI